MQLGNRMSEYAFIVLTCGYKLQQHMLSVHHICLFQRLKVGYMYPIKGTNKLTKHDL